MGFIFEIFLSNSINMIKNYSCRCKFWPAYYVASTQRDSNMIIWISLFHLVLPIHEITTLYMIASAQYTQSTTLLCSLSLPRHVRFRNSNRYYFTPPFIQLFSKTKKNKLRYVGRNVLKYFLNHYGSVSMQLFHLKIFFNCILILVHKNILIK